jgi:phosphoglycolate phosphatase
MFSDCKYVIFDLDGTITDPEVGITTSAKFALSEMGYKEQAEQDLRWMIGPPLADTFIKITGCDKQEAQRLIDKYRERYSVLGVHENTLYPGIRELLQALKNEDIVLAIASSKPTLFVEQILDDFNIKEFFTVVQGSDMAGKHVEKEDVLKFAIEKLAIAEKDIKNTVMVGDRKFDAIAAKKFGLKTIAVTYGYAVDGEWENIEVDYFAQTPQEILNYEG